MTHDASQKWKTPRSIGKSYGLHQPSGKTLTGNGMTHVPGRTPDPEEEKEPHLVG